MQEQKYLADDEIDLKELFKTIWDKRLFIVLFTSIVTFISIIYVYFKNPTPIYQGQVYIEIGKIHSENFGEKALDVSTDLAEMIKLKYNTITNIPKGTSNLLEIISTDTDKENIKSTLDLTVAYILSRHEEKAKFYKNVTMTKQINDITINNEQINKPKKKLIVAVSFITAFILSIFLIFFIQFIRDLKSDNKD